MSALLILIPLFILWGSCLQSISYRLINPTHTINFICPACKHKLAWYDTIPLLSYIILQGSCRHCNEPISKRYPFMEIITPLLLTPLYLCSYYFFGYFIFFSALLIIIHSDLESMLISPWSTLALIPVGVICSITNTIPLYPLDSIMAAAIGFSSLWLVGFIFKALTGKDGIGHGDFDLFALIGSFTGLLGLWASLMIGSISGTLYAFAYMFFTGKFRSNTIIPFGPFLAFGAIIYVLVQELFHIS